jgi:hypothetical protein
MPNDLAHTALACRARRHLLDDRSPEDLSRRRSDAPKFVDLNCTDSEQLTCSVASVMFLTFQPHVLPQITHARLWQQMRRSLAMPTDPTKKPPSKAVNEPEQLEGLIRERAYELYESRGREDGHDLEDWLRAEEEVAQEKVRPIAA